MLQCPSGRPRTLTSPWFDSIPLPVSSCCPGVSSAMTSPATSAGYVFW